MPNEARATKDPWLHDDATVPESDEATLRRVRDAEESATAFESDPTTRRSAIPETLATSMHDLSSDELEVLIEEDEPPPG